MTVKKRSLFFCPSCGKYYKAEARSLDHSFTLTAAPRCSECDSPVQMTGFAFILIGIIVCLPIFLVLCAGATEIALGLSVVFLSMAVMRWIRQFRAKCKTANKPNRGGCGAMPTDIHADHPAGVQERKIKYLRTFLIVTVLLTVLDVLSYKTAVYWFPAQDRSLTPTSYDGLLWLIGLLGLLATFAGGFMQCPVILLLKVLQVRPSSLPLNGSPLIIFLSASMYTGLHILIDIQRKKGMLNTVQRDNITPNE